MTSTSASTKKLCNFEAQKKILRGSVVAKTEKNFKTDFQVAELQIPGALCARNSRFFKSPVVADTRGI